MGLLELFILLLVLAWLLGAVVVPVGGSLIHLLLIVIACLVIYKLLKGKSL